MKKISKSLVFERVVFTASESSFAGALDVSHVYDKRERLASREKNKFPEPIEGQYPDNESFFCSRKYVLDLYYKYFGERRQKITCVMRAWFEKEARDAGWARVEFLKDIQSNSSAGCMLGGSMQREVQ